MPQDPTNTTKTFKIFFEFNIESEERKELVRTLVRDLTTILTVNESINEIEIDNLQDVLENDKKFADEILSKLLGSNPAGAAFSAFGGQSKAGLSYAQFKAYQQFQQQFSPTIQTNQNKGKVVP